MRDTRKKVHFLLLLFTQWTLAFEDREDYPPMPNRPEEVSLLPCKRARVRLECPSTILFALSALRNETVTELAKCLSPR